MRAAAASAFPAGIRPRDAVVLQRELASRVEPRNRFRALRTVAGADVALDPKRKLGFAVAAVFRLPGLEEVERAHAEGPLEFPYVPGLLSFREGPLLLAAFAKLARLPDLLIFDGQGIAHPRRIGLAAHLGVALDRPAIGAAKSRLCGTHAEPGRERGAMAPLFDGGDVIGAVLRTRAAVRPIYVSIGHRVDLATAVELVLACGDGYRMPKPTRLADRYVGELARAARASG